MEIETLHGTGAKRLARLEEVWSPVKMSGLPDMTARDHAPALKGNREAILV